ncbi:glycosyltransferase family 1 protein [Nodosilinea sp. FACHB-131]|uniref:glycosyltransferase family 1 protein n=1 Tax=Cyanophyceae TaxID=3028117 RepID=UPI001682EBD5|nr:glycosyltransferase family 1 protein [Nodosilinea sp. FACHB-131]MBD1874769.1 glycosyltransferase family 1 protein [Nodosilinea sp. FACHB-131]
MSTHYISESYFNRRLSEKKLIEDQPYLEQSAASLSLRWPEGTELTPPVPGTPDLVCFSHLRWDFVYQRPQHLLNRCAQARRVFIVEEPIAVPDETSWLDISRRDSGVWIVVPHISESQSDEEFTLSLQQLLNALFAEAQIQQPILWYYTPMAVPFTHHLPASAVVYDCMDELSAFKGAHPQLQAWEARLFEMADLVFTGGHSLYEAKQHQHSSVHAFPSSIDAAHFAQARQPLPEPHDQAEIPHPRMGFYGVIDERLDLELLDGIAQARPDWHLVMVGPVVKIDAASLPQRPNIHYLGGKSYQELPHYLAGWDVALLLFARNESTRFISPTKTPEYLAGGKPVVSTSIKDVVRPYGDESLVHIADTVPEFVEAIAAALSQSQTPSDWLDRVDARLAQTSWDLTWQAMNDRIEEAIATNARQTTPSKTKYPTAIAANVDQLAI